MWWIEFHYSLLKQYSREASLHESSQLTDCLSLAHKLYWHNAFDAKSNYSAYTGRKGCLPLYPYKSNCETFFECTSWGDTAEVNPEISRRGAIRTTWRWRSISPFMPYAFWQLNVPWDSGIRRYVSISFKIQNSEFRIQRGITSRGNFKFNCRFDQLGEFVWREPAKATHTQNTVLSASILQSSESPAYAQQTYVSYVPY